MELSSGPRAVFAPAQQPAAHLAGWALCLLPTAPARGGAAARLLSPASHVGQGSSEQWAVVCCCIFAAAPNRGRAPPGSGRDFGVMSQCCRWAETGCAARVIGQRQVSRAARWTGAAAAAGPQWFTLEFHLPRPIIPVHFTEEFLFLCSRVLQTHRDRSPTHVEIFWRPGLASVKGLSFGVGASARARPGPACTTRAPSLPPSCNAGCGGF